MDGTSGSSRIAVEDTIPNLNLKIVFDHNGATLGRLGRFFSGHWQTVVVVKLATADGDLIFGLIPPIQHHDCAARVTCGVARENRVTYFSTTKTEI